MAQPEKDPRPLYLLTPKQTKAGWQAQSKAYLTRAFGIVAHTPQRAKGAIVQLDCFIGATFNKTTGQQKIIRHVIVSRTAEFIDNQKAFIWAKQNANQRWPCQLYKDPFAQGFIELFANTHLKGNLAFAMRLMPFFDPLAEPTKRGQKRLAANRLAEEAIVFSEFAEAAGQGQVSEFLKQQDEPRDMLQMDKIFAKSSEAVLQRVPNKTGVVEVSPAIEPAPEILALFCATAAWSGAIKNGQYQTKEAKHTQRK